jgi:hypothetical protein
MAGVVEVSNLLVTQNRVITAARASTGFGAANVAPEAWTEDNTWADSMASVARNSVTETLVLTDDRWDVWTIKATVNNAGTDFDEWLMHHPFGNYTVKPETEWTNELPQTKADTLTELQADGTSAGGLQIVATIAYYNADSILGLPVLEHLAGMNALRALSVMRVDNPLDYEPCELFPITIHVNNFTLYPEGYTGGAVYEPGVDPVNVYERNAWLHPNPGVTYSTSNPSGYPLNDPGKRLELAKRGYIYPAREGYGPGNFGWLSWDGNTAASALLESMSGFGNLSLITPPEPGHVNYVNPDDPDDRVPNIGDWVQGAAGNMNNMRSLLEEYIDNGKTMTIIAFDDVRGNGSGFDYRIAGFLEINLVNYQTTGSDKMILVQIQNWSTNLCTLPSE